MNRGDIKLVIDQLNQYANGDEFQREVEMAADMLEPITRLEELQELYASSAFNTNYWKAKAEAAEKDAAKYQELIYAVGRKFPNETRHETALKYIRQMETKGWNAAGKESEK